MQSTGGARDHVICWRAGFPFETVVNGLAQQSCSLALSTHEGSQMILNIHQQGFKKYWNDGQSHRLSSSPRHYLHPYLERYVFFLFCKIPCLRLGVQSHSFWILMTNLFDLYLLFNAILFKVFFVCSISLFKITCKGEHKASTMCWRLHNPANFSCSTLLPDGI